MVDCIFIHSLSPRLLSDSVYDALEDLKKSGVTRKIGVSADNEDLSYFRQLSIFDSYMSTLNLVDQRNLSQIKLLVEKKDLEVTIKRALANAAWTQKRIPKLKNIVKNLGKTGNKDDTQSYPFRHKFLSSVSEQHLNGWMYMQYSLSWNTSAKVLIGTSRISHLQLFRDIEKEKRLVAEEIDAIENLWKLGQLYDWKAIV
jgi:aryl-alcohol dehydrogenase-like predicted oxidoreductase